MENFQDVLHQISSAADLQELETLKTSILGHQGILTKKMHALRLLEPEKKMKEGKALNLFKREITKALEDRKSHLVRLKENVDFKKSAQDSTIPVPYPLTGRLHPLMETLQEITDIFSSMGFSIEEGPEIEEDYYNFTALRIPPHHPARSTQDTFYFPKQGDKLPHMLRSQTSPGQARVMEKTDPPLRIVIPGRVYRVDDWDATHVPMFHQIEGLLVDKDINMGHLKGTLQEFANRFFQEEMSLQFRPSFFPFTEPSAEVDILLTKKTGGETSTEWLEVLGCGMVHPEILQTCNIDRNVYKGFAFGMGVERLAMLKYGINDLRHFFDNDLRWLGHYGFAPWF